MTRVLLLVLAALVAAPASAQTAKLTVFVGDSTSARLPWVAGGIGWVERLQLVRQQQRFAVLNLAVGGLRTDQMETDVFVRDVVASGKGRGQTRVVLQGGINDLLQGRTADEIYGTAGTPGPPGSLGSSTTPGPLLRMINACTAAGILVTVVTVSPLGGSYNYPAPVQAEHMDLNARIRGKVGVTTPSMVTVVDLYRALGQTGPIATALATDPGAGVTMPGAYNYNDGIHYSTNGNVSDATTGDGRVAEAFGATAGAL